MATCQKAYDPRGMPTRVVEAEKFGRMQVRFYTVRLFLCLCGRGNPLPFYFATLSACEFAPTWDASNARVKYRFCRIIGRSVMRIGVVVRFSIVISQAEFPRISNLQIHQFCNL